MGFPIAKPSLWVIANVPGMPDVTANQLAGGDGAIQSLLATRSDVPVDALRRLYHRGVDINIANAWCSEARRSDEIDHILRVERRADPLGSLVYYNRFTVEQGERLIVLAENRTRLRDQIVSAEGVPMSVRRRLQDRCSPQAWAVAVLRSVPQDVDDDEVLEVALRSAAEPKKGALHVLPTALNIRPQLIGPLAEHGQQDPHRYQDLLRHLCCSSALRDPAHFEMLANAVTGGYNGPLYWAATGLVANPYAPRSAIKSLVVGAESAPQWSGLFNETLPDLRNRLTNNRFITEPVAQVSDSMTIDWIIDEGSGCAQGAPPCSCELLVELDTNPHLSDGQRARVVANLVKCSRRQGEPTPRPMTPRTLLATPVAETKPGLAESLGRSLAGDPERWSLLLALVDDHDGSWGELLDLVRSLAR